MFGDWHMGKLDLAVKQDLEQLAKYQSCEQIGLKYGCSAELVRRKLHKLGIKVTRKRFDPPKEDLEALYQTKSMLEIAEHYGVGQTVVWKRLKEHGIELRGFVNHRLKPGRQFSVEHRKNLSLAHTGRWVGDKNPNWKDGIHKKNLAIRASGVYKQWRVAALNLKGSKCEACGVEQDSVCECCGYKIRLHVHHIRPFAKYPELRFDPANAEVLCPKCHKARHD
jgi:5-methylcytosine-specific restriction endonuclease McrA